MPPIPVTPPHVSINRVHIVDLPGAHLATEVRGRTAYELLSQRALIELVHVQAAALALPAALSVDTPQSRSDLPVWFAACFDSDQPQIRAAAEDIGGRLGERLGWVLLALHRGDAMNRAARQDWNASDWERWAQMCYVWLAGGLASGPLGAAMVTHACALLAAHAAPLTLALSPYQPCATLIGAGRYLPADTTAAIICDFGHTRVKRGCLTLSGGDMTQVISFAPDLVDLEWLGQGLTPNPVTGQRVLDFMADALARTWQEAQTKGLSLDPQIMVSVAAYVDQGHLFGNGLYANLNVLAADARPLLAAALHRRLAAEVQVEMIHDGTAAAAVHAGSAHTAMLVLGTAWGVGFAPESAEGMRGLPPPPC